MAPLMLFAFTSAIFVVACIYMHNVYQAILLVNTWQIINQTGMPLKLLMAFSIRFYCLFIIFHWPFYQISFFMALKLNRSQVG